MRHKALSIITYLALSGPTCALWAVDYGGHVGPEKDPITPDDAVVVNFGEEPFGGSETYVPQPLAPLPEAVRPEASEWLGTHEQEETTRQPSRAVVVLEEDGGNSLLGWVIILGLSAASTFGLRGWLARRPRSARTRRITRAKEGKR